MCDLLLAKSVKAVHLASAEAEHAKLSNIEHITTPRNSRCKPERGASSYWHPLAMVDLGMRAWRCPNDMYCIPWLTC